MTRPYLSILFAVIAFTLVSCSQQPQLKMPTEDDFLPDLVIPTKLTKKQLDDNNLVKSSYLTQKETIAKIAAADIAEKVVVAERRKATEEAEKKLTSKILQKVIEQDEVVKKLMENKEIAAMVEEASSEEELILKLRENTDLNEEEIQKLVKLKKIQIAVASAETEEELQRILEENTELSKTEIAALVEEKKKIVEEKEELQSDILARIYERLKRNRAQNVEAVFCVQAARLDQYLIAPVFYGFDSYSVGKDSAQKLFDEAIDVYDDFTKYEGLALQLEGNCDERGSNAYNKSLGDRRWSSAEPFLTAQTFDEDEIMGVSRGEECQTVRKSDDFEAWWKENRRVDFIWVLK